MSLPVPRTFLAILWSLSIFSGLAAFYPLSAAEARLLNFDIPPGEALKTLKYFTSQADTPLLYSVAAIKGVKTNEIRGQFTPIDALQHMVAGTELRVTADNPSGALTITRQPPAKTDSPEAKPKASAANEDPEETLPHGPAHFAIQR